MNEKITEQFIVNKIIEFMINKQNGNWHEEKVEKSELHKHGVDIKLVGGKRNSEYFYYALSDYILEDDKNAGKKVRNDATYNKDYLTGRYGAITVLEEFDIDYEK